MPPGDERAGARAAAGNVFRPHGPAAAAGRPALVFLPGWGFDGRILDLAAAPVAAYAPAGPLDPATLVADLLAFLDRTGIDRVHLVGWSLGAHLALDFGRAHPERLASLTLIAMRGHWPTAEISAIRRDLAAAPAAFLAAFYRKCLAGDKAAQRRFAASLEGEYLAGLDLGLLNRGLDYLAATLPQAPAAAIPLRLAHGRRDLIAPLADRAVLAGASEEVFDHAGHAVFLGPSFSWPGHDDPAARKRAIRDRFSRAAATYDAHADVQKEVAQGLAARLGRITPAGVLEIGCGSGFYTGLLAARFPGARLLALDFSPGMADATAARFAANPRVRVQCQDGEEYLAGAGERFDLITSNATLQWFDDPLLALTRMATLLNPGGMLLCSLFGPRTLAELAQGLSAVCGRQVALPPQRFPALAALAGVLAGRLADVECGETLLCRHYGSLRELLGHIRLTGTGGWPAGERPLLTRRRFRELEAWFGERHNGFPATYQAFYLRGRLGAFPVKEEQA